VTSFIRNLTRPDRTLVVSHTPSIGERLFGLPRDAGAADDLVRGIEVGRPLRRSEASIPSFLSATRLSSLWDRLRISFWFLPSTMAGTSMALSFVLVQVDAWLGVDGVRDFGWLYTFGPEGARAVLSAIAGSMITVAGLTFSITMLTLQLASSQFGPRLLRIFMRDRGNQLVLGTFIATFLYCLLVLRTVRGTEGPASCRTWRWPSACSSPSRASRC
jgi:hypothetical protein